jgi:hypothetical protein
MFHKSHSRKDLIDIIKIFKLPIEDADDFNKKVLSEKLHKCLYDEIDAIIPDDHYYGIKDLHELKEYLIKPNQKKVLSVKDKNEIMTTAKLIIQYCKSGYCVDISYFDSMDTIYTEARRVAQFGDIPSVRRMCNLLNKNPHSNEIIMPIISKKVQKDLEIKELTSQKIHCFLSIRKEKVIVSFD